MEHKQLQQPDAKPQEAVPVSHGSDAAKALLKQTGQAGDNIDATLAAAQEAAAQEAEQVRLATEHATLRWQMRAREREEAKARCVCCC